MKIKNKLLFITGFSGLTIIVLGIFLYFSFQSFNLVIEKNKIANQVADNVFEKNLLLIEYLLYHDDRPRDTWLTKNDGLVALIKVQSDKFTKTREKETISNLLEGVGKNQKTFLELGALQGRDGSVDVVNTERQARLVAEILINNQEAVSSVKTLTVISSQDADGAKKIIAYILVGFIAVLYLIAAIVVYFIWNSIGEPLIALKESALRIAFLDFTTTTTTNSKPSNDEMGQLARAFDIMVEKVKESYIKLRDQARNLEQSEENLKKILAESERANKLMVGRELKMIELKKEIKKHSHES